MKNFLTKISALSHTQRMAELMRSLKNPDYAVCVAAACIEASKQELRDVEGALDLLMRFQRSDGENGDQKK